MELRISGRGAAGLVFGVVGVWLLISLWPILLLLIIALIFMAALLPQVEWLTRHGLRRALAVAVVFIILIAAFGGLLALVIPPLISQAASLQETLPEDARRLSAVLSEFGLDVDLETPARELDWSRLVSGSVALDFGQQALVVLFSVLTILVLTAYLLAGAPRLLDFVYGFVPSGHEPTFDLLLSGFGRVVGGYVRAQAVTSLLAGAFTLVACLAFGLPNAVAFGVLAAFTDAIPIVGVFLATIPPVYQAFQESTGKALALLGLLVLYQQFEDRILIPRVYGSTLNLPPLVVVIAVLVGAQLLGIVGVLLALPAAAAIRVVLDFYRDRRLLNAKQPAPADEPVAPD